MCLEACASEHADGRRAPERGRGVEATNAKAFLEYQAGAEITDAGDDLCGNARRAGVAGN